MRLSAYPTFGAVPRDIGVDLALVIDTLRMTSVAATAFSNGCARMLAVETIEEARTLADRYGALAGGERGGLRVDGFDLGNSPLEYTARRVSGRSIVVTTTNGTRAVARVKCARNVWLASLLNADAVAERIRESGFADVALVCAGTAGRFSMEDALTAGAIASRLGDEREADDFTLACKILYRALARDIRGAMAGSEHAGRLLRLGFAGDLDYCAREGTLKSVPALGGDGWFTSA
ncbi:MAG: 2-phosphosulfolactate phosphatase [Oscillospiraceae bacterium]|jgi:2-phosphosulfolactate phosphatase|nr:2-phosphosulfolactate phosphatase [Oscillospiraceae bacterium]